LVQPLAKARQVMPPVRNRIAWQPGRPAPV